MAKFWLWQREFNHAIANADTNKLILTMSHGAKIKNHNNKENTLNRAIKIMLSKPQEEFNIKFIKDLLEKGAQICNNDSENNTLIVIIRCVDQYTGAARNKNKNEEKAMNNIFELIQLILLKKIKISGYVLCVAIQNGNIGIVKLICNHGVESESNPMILIEAIKTKNIEIIKLVIGTNPGANSDTLIEAINTNNLEIIQLIFGTYPCSDSKVLNHAIKTSDLEIVKMICEYGVPINASHTLSLAIETVNPMIVKEIIMRGGKPSNIPEFLVNMNLEYDKNLLINLLMCSGSWIPFYIYHKIEEKEEDKRSPMELKILDCHDLYYRCYRQKSKNQRINELKEELINVMDQLVNGPMTKKTRINQIMTAINGHMIPPLIEIVYEYQIDISLVKFIDWSKY